jgi:hypothetical protein
VKRIVTAILIASAVLLTAQTPKVLTNQDVVDMVAAKLSDSVIVGQIHKSPCKFSTDVQDLIALKKAGVSDAVIEAMQNAGAPGPAAAPGIQTPFSRTINAGATPSGATPNAGGNAPGDPNDPLQPHDSGIYLSTKAGDGKPQMIALERAAEQGTKTSTHPMMFTSMKTKAEIPGAHAGIVVSESSPVFYFYFDEKQAGLGRTHFGVSNLSNPNQFALLKLDVKKSSRETTIGKFSAFGGMSSGSDTKAMVQFKSERLQPGLYKVTVEDIKPGEYCFLSQGGPVMMGPYGGAAGGATDIFDFGVNTQ